MNRNASVVSLWLVIFTLISFLGGFWVMTHRRQKEKLNSGPTVPPKPYVSLSEGSSRSRS